MGLPSRSKAAFLFNAENLWQPGFRVYFWTFTFRDVLSDWDASKRFSDFLRLLRMTLGGDFSGVKVAELHKAHGVHFHVLVNRRLCVRRVRRLWDIKQRGGRVHVCVADQNSAGYLSKYLGKGKEAPLTESGRKQRRWACFGPRRKTRCSDVVMESPMWEFRRKNCLTFTTYRYEFFLNRCWLLGEDVLRSAWVAAQAGRDRDVCALAQGILRPSRLSRVYEWACELVERNPLGGEAWGTACPVAF